MAKCGFSVLSLGLEDSRMPLCKNAAGFREFVQCCIFVRCPNERDYRNNRNFQCVVAEFFSLPKLQEVISVNFKISFSNFRVETIFANRYRSNPSNTQSRTIWKIAYKHVLDDRRGFNLTAENTLAYPFGNQFQATNTSSQTRREPSIVASF